MELDGVKQGKIKKGGWIAKQVIELHLFSVFCINYPVICSWIKSNLILFLF